MSWWPGCWNWSGCRRPRNVEQSGGRCIASSGRVLGTRRRLGRAMMWSRDDAVATLIGATPANGYEWPSDAEGRFCVVRRTQGGPLRAFNVLDLRLMVTTYALAVGVAVLTRSFVPLFTIGSVGALFLARATVRLRCIDRRLREAWAAIEGATDGG